MPMFMIEGGLARSFLLNFGSPSLTGGLVCVSFTSLAHDGLATIHLEAVAGSCSSV